MRWESDRGLDVRKPTLVWKHNTLVFIRMRRSVFVYMNVIIEQINYFFPNACTHFVESNIELEIEQTKRKTTNRTFRFWLYNIFKLFFYLLLFYTILQKPIQLDII